MGHEHKKFSVGSAVQWKWMGRAIVGSVVEVHTNAVSKVIKEKIIKRNGTETNPAYLVQSASGNLALKLHSELEVFDAKDQKPNRPKMFSN